MSMTPQYLIKDPSGFIHGPSIPQGYFGGYPYNRGFQAGLVGQNAFAGQGSVPGLVGPTPLQQGQQPVPAQTSSQNMTPEQNAPKGQVTQPAPGGLNYGYGNQQTYGLPVPPTPGAAPVRPTAAAAPQAPAPGEAPKAPQVANTAPVSYQNPITERPAPQFMQAPSVISIPPLNPLHEAIQQQAQGTAQFSAPAEATARYKRRPSR